MPAQSDILTSDALVLAGVPADVAVPYLALPWQIAQSRTSGRNRSIGVQPVRFKDLLVESASLQGKSQIPPLVYSTRSPVVTRMS
jgi:hypothetical protein